MIKDFLLNRMTSEMLKHILKKLCTGCLEYGLVFVQRLGVFNQGEICDIEAVGSET